MTEPTAQTLEVRVDDHERRLDKHEKAIDSIKNRPPVWSTTIQALLVGAVGLLIGLIIRAGVN